MNTEVGNARPRVRNWLAHIRAKRISPTERAVIAAQGKALAMLATTLQSRGHLDARRLAEMLALFGTVVGEEDRLQGAILASWSDAMNESLDLSAEIAA